jgi:hypothetical protein
MNAIVLHITGCTRWQFCSALGFQAYLKTLNLPVPYFSPLYVFSIALSRVESSYKGARHRTLASQNHPQNKVTASNGADELWPSGFQSCTMQSASCAVSHTNLVVILVLWYWLLLWWRKFERAVRVKIIRSTIQNVAFFFIVVNLYWCFK